MLSDVSELLRCKKIIEQKLDWGSSENWQSTDFENLNQLILDETGVSLSVSTLRRIWGRVEYNHLPSVTTLNTLARFAGFQDWRSFVKQHYVSNENPQPVPQEKKYKTGIPTKKIAWISGCILIIGLISILAFQNNRQPKNATYSFSSKPITREIPNSVIFTYDAADSPTDSVFIQQSWDSRNERWLIKNLIHIPQFITNPAFILPN